MISKALPFIFILAALSGARADPGINGNDTGGIIPWSPANEQLAIDLSGAHCASYGKIAQLTSVYRQPGHYIGFACVLPRGYIVRNRGIVVRSRG